MHACTHIHTHTRLQRNNIIQFSSVQSLSRVWLSATSWAVAHQASLSMGFSREEYRVDIYSLLQGIFLTQGSNLGLLHCRQILLPSKPRFFSQSEIFQNKILYRIWLSFCSGFFASTGISFSVPGLQTLFSITAISLKLHKLS